ncbi:TPA: alpha-1/alpha-2 family phenol-soluble modulin [Staphylococcus aureus]|nr:alpha-1/alpha-2 family phenol-soluble modulin [Staphylococcus aureus]HEH0597075.1 alpha-1/alpha-2 family phenol-soluble modulin [Staphylococcus aureus]
MSKGGNLNGIIAGIIKVIKSLIEQFTGK